MTSYSSDHVTFWQMQELFKTFDIDGDEKISRDDFMSCLGRFPFLIAFFAAPINGEVYIEIVWMPEARRCRVRVKGWSCQAQAGDPSVYAMGYPPGLLHFETKSPLVLGCIKWLTSIVRRFCLVASFRLLYCHYGMLLWDTRWTSRLSMELRMHIESICNLNSKKTFLDKQWLCNLKFC